MGEYIALADNYSLSFCSVLLFLIAEQVQYFLLSDIEIL